MTPPCPRFTAARDRLAFSRHGRAGRGCYDNRLEATVIGHIKPDAALRRWLPATSTRCSVRLSSMFSSELSSELCSCSARVLTQVSRLGIRLGLSSSWLDSALSSAYLDRSPARLTLAKLISAHIFLKEAIHRE